jgi:hypothetical protein
MGVLTSSGRVHLPLLNRHGFCSCEGGIEQYMSAEEKILDAFDGADDSKMPPCLTCLQ